MGYVIPASPEHIPQIDARGRQADRDEVMAGHGWTLSEGLRHSLATSTLAWTGMVGDEPVVMFGVSPASVVGGKGIPWLLGTDAIARHQMAFLRHSRRMVGQMAEIYPVLENWVDDRNELSKRWLAWLGFVVGLPQPYGVDRLPFRPFSMRAR